MRIKNCLHLCVFLCICFVFINHANAQKKAYSYTISGTINSDTGKIILSPISEDTAYYLFKSQIETTVKNGEFKFTDSIYYPTAYKLNLQKNGETVYTSNMFIIDSGQQTIDCNIDSMLETPKVNNSTMNEDKKGLGNKMRNCKVHYDEYYSLHDSLYAVFNNKLPDSISMLLAGKRDFLHYEYYQNLLNYTKENHNSYIVLWTLIYGLKRGYDPVYDTIYHQLSRSIQRTPTGIRFAEKIRSSKGILPGNIFPQLNLLDSNFASVQLPVYHKAKGYTLIDFWFSHCSACIYQFTTLKKLYTAYKNKGFEIIGISVDQTQYLKDWKNIMQEKELVWTQYWDKDLKNATFLSIEGFPTNFLLDKNGIIIKRDIKPADLEKLLAE